MDNPGDTLNMNAATRLSMAGLSHPGQVRDENEDCVVTRPDLGLAVLADGMGGHQAGEVASRMAVDLIVRHFADRATGSVPDVLCVLTEAIQNANAAVHRAAQDRAEYRGMGSTVVVAVVRDNRLYVGHAGDSRLYRSRQGTLEQLTTDHSVVQELVTRGLFTPEEARQSLSKNLVTRALGVDATIDVETGETNVEPGDVYLLCSDGLTDIINDDEVRDALRDALRDVDATAHRLIAQANARGAPDNVSVILISVNQ